MMTSTSSARVRPRESGFTLLEMLGVLAIGAILMAGLSAMFNNSLADLRSQQAGLYQQKLTDAASKYISANYSTLSATLGVTQKLAVSDLITAGLLPDNFATKNAYGQTPCVLMRAMTKTVSGVSTNVVNALVVTEGSSSRAIPEKDLPMVAADAGSGGGYISTTSPTTASGAFGSWKITASTSPALSDFIGSSCSGVAATGGSLASALFYDGPGQLSTDFVYRNAVSGRAELNQMNTPLLMAGSAVVTENASCGTAAALAVDSSKRLMFCDSTGLWAVVSGSWKAPVATYSALPTTDHAGDVRMVKANSRAYSYNGSQWVALAVDDAGNLAVPGNINVTAGNVTIGSGNFVTNKGDITTASGNITTSSGNLVASNGNVNTPNGGLNGNYVNADTWAFLVAVQIAARKTPGEACHQPKTDGTVGFNYPIGVFVLDNPAYGYPPLPMVCSGYNQYDAHYVYMDGTTSRADGGGGITNR
jgi:prepilin-type N-terminal cleavage/methylation domain-containing protein